MKMVIEVSGGCVTNIEASDEVSIYLVDHDSLKGRLDAKSIEDARRAFQPDFIGTEEEVMERLEETLAKHVEALADYNAWSESHR